jgi:hypothetical protein
LAAGLGTEKRRGAGAQRRPSDLGAPGLPAAALLLRLSHAVFNGRSGSQADTEQMNNP